MYRTPLLMTINDLQRHSTDIVRHIYLQCILDARQSSSPRACISRHHHQMERVWHRYTNDVVMQRRHQIVLHTVFQKQERMEVKRRSNELCHDIPYVRTGFVFTSNSKPFCANPACLTYPTGSLMSTNTLWNMWCICLFLRPYISMASTACNTRRSCSVPIIINPSGISS